MSEELTKGLVKKRLLEVGYPKNQNEFEEDIICYKEDSYKSGINSDKILADAFLKASKRLTGNEGSPDYTIKDNKDNFVIVIECKSSVDKHGTHENLENYKNGLGNEKEISQYCINGALHYATFLTYKYDVIAIATSGIEEDNFKTTSFLIPKGGNLKDLIILEDGDYENTIMSADEYKRIIIENSLDYVREKEVIYQELKNYANSCNNYLRANQIDPKDRAGFISAIVLALTNKNSDFYKSVERAMPNDYIKKPFSEELGNNAIKRLWESLEEIWSKIDNLPEIKKKKLREYYSSILLDNLLYSPEGESKYFKYGDNILTRFIYSIYKNISIKLEQHSDMDIMGTFYTSFLKYARGAAKDKGVVLTPKHITELFCDIAEYYLGKKLDENTKVIDICTGTGGFLISALNRMDRNIDNQKISNDVKKEKKSLVRKNCLIGVEREPSMFALAYANMRFHGDGKSNLYSCSSLLKDKGEANEDFKTGRKITLQEEIEGMNIKPIVGMINPPYSLLNTKNKREENKQSGQSELDFVYSMLEYLDKGGIGIAIVPMSCASSKDDLKMRKKIMEKHTLLSVMTMPKKLFQDSHVGTSTCIMVFKAHIKHKDSNNNVFLARWLDDGFVTVPHSGRFDKNGNWISIKNEWLRELKGLSKENSKKFLRKELKASDEWLAEAYVETDYSQLNDTDFINQIKKYALFKYLDENFEGSDLDE